MNEISDWKIPKWPFLAANVVLIIAAAVVVAKAAHPISQNEMGIASACVALGALLGCLPFILEYRAVKKREAAAAQWDLLVRRISGPFEAGKGEVPASLLHGPN